MGIPRQPLHRTAQVTQKINGLNKQGPTGIRKVFRLDDEGKIVPAGSVRRACSPTLNSGVTNGPLAISTSESRTPAAVTNTARAKQDRYKQLRLSEMIESGDHSLKTKQYNKALETYGKILKEMKELGYQGTSKEGDEQIYRVQRSLGKALMLLGKLDLAERVLERTLKSMAEQLGDDHSLTLRIRFDIAALKSRQRMWPVAIRLHTEALHAVECFRGDDHTFLGEARRSLARLYDLSGNIEKSEKHYRLAIACCIRASGHSNQMTISSIIDLAQFLQKHGVYRTVTGLDRRTLPLFKRLESADEEESVESIVDVLRLLTNAFKSKGRLEEALLTCERAVALAASLPKPDVQNADPFWAQVAEHLYSKNQYREAENIWRALWIQLREKCGLLHFDTRKAMESVASCLLQQGLLHGDKLMLGKCQKTRSEEDCDVLTSILGMKRLLKRLEEMNKDEKDYEEWFKTLAGRLLIVGNA